VRDGPVSRRRVLTGLAVTALITAGCSATATDSPPADSSRSDPDLAIRAAAADSERMLLAAYAATIARHPALSERLVPLSAHHSEHAAAFAEAAPDPTANPTGTEEPTAFAPTTPAIGVSDTSSPVSDDPVAALAALAAAERAAAAQRLSELELASPGLARLLASTSGAEAAHAALLGS
jgi:hypothetical protein